MLQITNRQEIYIFLTEYRIWAAVKKSRQSHEDGIH